MIRILTSTPRHPPPASCGRQLWPLQASCGHLGATGTLLPRLALVHCVHVKRVHVSQWYALRRCWRAAQQLSQRRKRCLFINLQSTDWHPPQRPGSRNTQRCTIRARLKIAEDDRCQQSVDLELAALLTATHTSWQTTIDASAASRLTQQQQRWRKRSVWIDATTTVTQAQRIDEHNCINRNCEH